MSTFPGAVPAPASSLLSGAGKTLTRTVTWKSAFVVSLGGSLLVAVSLGPMAADLGPASVFVWTFTAMLGVLQCLMVAELAGMFPHKSGGTATYTHEGFKNISPLFGAVSNWGYWLGWIPVIPVNLILAAGYMKAFVPSLTDPQILGTAIVMAALLYVLNYFGLKPGIWSSVVIATCALVPLAVIALAPVVKPSLFHAAFVFPMAPLHGSWHSHASWMLIFKWMFVAVWSSYAFESASTVIAELKDPHKDGPKAMGAASAVGLFAYGLVPFMLLAIVGTTLLSQDASVAFLPAAKAIFGEIGGKLVSLMLIAALLLGAQTAIIGSSRTVYEMSRDGLTLTQYGKLNKYGTPVGSMIWDAGVTLLLLLIFKNNIVNLVACSNVGYLLTFMLLPIAYVLLRLQQPNAARPFALPSFFVPVAAAVALFNWVLFFIGGFQWGKTVMLTGGVIMLMFVPFFLIRRYVQGVGPQLAFSAGSLPEMQEGDDDLSGRREVIHSSPDAETPA